MGAVFDFAERAKAAAAASQDRVHREATAEAMRVECERRRDSVADIAMDDDVRRMVIANQLDERTFRALRAVRVWLSRPEPWLMLGGSTGRGKTVACIDAVASRGGVLIEAPDLARLWSSRLVADVQRRNRILQAPTVAIDDAGYELAADRPIVCQALVQLLNVRSSTRFRTIVTFNGDAPYFRALYADERLHSRLEKYAAFVIDAGPDMRRKGSRQ